MSSTRRLELTTLEASGFRNLRPLRIALHAEVNVFYGDNGQGKTSVLEAVYCAATSRSFRTTRLRELRAHDQASLRVAAMFRTGGVPDPISYCQTAVYQERKLLVRVDENKPASLAEFARRSPVVVFHPEELALSTGPASLRRRLLDRIALYQAPMGFEALTRYRKAMQSRLDLLKRRAGDAELTAYESIAADAGAQLTRARRTASHALTEHALHAFARIGGARLQLTLEYVPGGSDSAEQLMQQFSLRRERDARAGAAGHGPHRDELAIRLSDHDVRKVASQGQHRAIALSLKAAESQSIREAIGQEPILLLDDISSELDPERTTALFSFLSEMRGQLLLTTTRPELIEAALPTANSKYFQVVAGEIIARTST